ncbi:hypothetical protein ACJ72_08703 [Emergomyces africanus]|uniref:DUF3074 domain-containing protein n=1 Tax=Emergomyces africanus TaxID=1955775 RepID=A0A1B7NJL9_9EURO|nr:hypothetical protein ACJ72_08703 [Emergomyces africanus]
MISAFTPPESPTSTEPSGFINIQLPIHFSALPSSISLPKGAIQARYASVEQVRILPDAGDGAGPGPGPGQIEWIMATSASAGGWIPEFLQHSGIPTAIVQDVGNFLQWVDERRAQKVAK